MITSDSWRLHRGTCKLAWERRNSALNKRKIKLANNNKNSRKDETVLSNYTKILWPSGFWPIEVMVCIPIFRRKILPASSELKCLGLEIYFFKLTCCKKYVHGTLGDGVKKVMCSEYKTTRCQNPGDHNFNSHHRVNLMRRDMSGLKWNKRNTDREHFLMRWFINCKLQHMNVGSWNWKG
jgi:hypothetical protein